MNKGPGAVFTHRPDPSGVRWRLSSPLGHQHQKKAVFPRLLIIKIQETASSRLSNHQIQRRYCFARHIRAATHFAETLLRIAPTHQESAGGFPRLLAISTKVAVFPRLSTIKIQKTVSSRLSNPTDPKTVLFRAAYQSATPFIAETII